MSIEDQEQLLLDTVEKVQHINDDYTTLIIMMYELGDMVKMFCYARRYETPEYLIEAKISLSDIIAQAVLLCKQMGWNFKDIKSLGIERCIEKINRRLSKGE